MEILLQLNGKFHDHMLIDDNADYDKVIQKAKTYVSEDIREIIEKIVYIPGKLVNIMTHGVL